MSKGEFTRMAMASILSDTEKDATIARLTAERDALKAELKEHDAEDIIIEAGWKAMERELDNYKPFLQQSIEIAGQRDAAQAELSELQARVERVKEWARQNAQ